MKHTKHVKRAARDAFASSVRPERKDSCGFDMSKCRKGRKDRCLLFGGGGGMTTGPGELAGFSARGAGLR